MKGKCMLYSWLFAIWLLISNASAAYAYTQVTPPSAWRTTPTLSKDMQPAYQFHSTSVYTPTMNVTVYPPGSSSPASGPNRMRRGIDDEEDDPDGLEVGMVDTPIGEPMILLLFALLYMLTGKRGWQRLKSRT